MKLTWLGHSCFLLEQDGYRVVTDPYTGVEGYPPLSVSAHAAYCSHHHFDHDAVDCVTALPPAESPFTVREVETCHDDRGGALRGSNTVRVFTAGGVSVAHLGDLGHQLTAEQLAAIGSVNAVLLPVGGVYTVDAAGAKAVCDALRPRCVIPMHYHHAPFGLPNVAGVEDFLRLWPSETIHRLSGPSFEVTAETTGVLVPVFQP
ncbi:MBL fold metallo-hydrolase [Oscillibacter sp.]|uniref:MBL fold metallo-hydrolase n=1 Tax=Oscillibacter sp. TaxID=1945593 RepID=UPI001B44E326|nr:MBL fold metallo-hydrolase [Oscillibacter sp.]MBP3508707.1 MBL fold metallo-hydrolase [Oscillibacter sp.]